MRPLNVLSSGVAILFSSFISGYQGPLEQILMPILVVVFFTIGANVLNDYFDYDTDKINRPDRSIVIGDITRKQALYFSLIFAQLVLVLDPICIALQDRLNQQQH